MNSRLASDDVNKEMTLSNFTSSEGEVHYLNTGSVDVRTRKGVADALSHDVTTTDPHVTVKTGRLIFRVWRNLELKIVELAITDIL